MRTRTTAHHNTQKMCVCVCATKQVYEMYSCTANRGDAASMAITGGTGVKVTFLNACRINTTKKDKASICDLLLDLRCNVDVNVEVWFVFCCE